MIGSFVANLVGAYTDPRASARRMLALSPSMGDSALMVLLAFAIQSLFGILLGMAGEAELAGFGRRISELALQFLLFAVLTMGAWLVGRRFGGRATPQSLAQVIAWHYLATSFLAPVNLIGAQAMTEGGGAGILFLLVPVSLGLSIWIFAAFVAEAHGFRRLGPVVLASIAGFVALGIFTMFIISLFVGAPPQG